MDANLSVVTGWVEAHPDTEFDFFFPPYSILYWDKMVRLGEVDAVLAAMERACGVLTAYDNVKLYGYLLDREIVENLDNYCDYIHHSNGVCVEILEMLRADEGRLTAENITGVLADWREFVVHYDYEKFWDENFWIAWNEAHGVGEETGA